MTSPTRRHEIIRAWLPTVIWILIVVGFSGDRFSARNTGGLIEAVIRWVYPTISPDLFEIVHFLIRKSAHLFNYAVLSMLAFRGARETNPEGRTWRWHMAALGLSLVVASMDEWLQAQTLDRTGDPRDVLIDMVGATIGQSLMVWWRSRGSSLRRRPARGR